MSQAALIAEAREASAAFNRIVGRVMQSGEPTVLSEFIEMFAAKSVDYGDGAQELGIKGQYADLNRKMIKLRRAMWEGTPLTGESLSEVLHDLAAHCFLSIDMINQEVQ